MDPEGFGLCLGLSKPHMEGFEQDTGFLSALRISLQSILVVFPGSSGPNPLEEEAPTTGQVTPGTAVP